MKLSKKNKARQRAIQKTIASGKALGGLLVGFAATVVGCGERYSPAHTMGVILDHTGQQVNATSEDTEVFVTGGVIAEPEPQPPQPKPLLSSGQYRVKDGDSLTKIAKTYGTTVAELKRLNGFDDVRANNLIAGEIIKVPQTKSNTVNEVKVGRRPPLPGALPPKPRGTLQK